MEEKPNHETPSRTDVFKSQLVDLLASGKTTDVLTLSQDEQDQASTRSLKIFYGVGLMLLLYGQNYALVLFIAAMSMGFIELEEWTVSLLASATLLQTYGIIRIVIKHLYPTNS